MNDSLDNTNLAKVHKIFADLYNDEESAKRILTESGIDANRIRFSTSAINFWHSILKEAINTKHVDDLFKVVLKEFPNNESLNVAYDTYKKSVESSSLLEIARNVHGFAILTVGIVVLFVIFVFLESFPLLLRLPVTSIEIATTTPIPYFEPFVIVSGHEKSQSLSLSASQGELLGIKIILEDEDGKLLPSHVATYEWSFEPEDSVNRQRIGTGKYYLFYTVPSNVTRQIIRVKVSTEYIQKTVTMGLNIIPQPANP